MFWADDRAHKIETELKETIASKEGGLIVRDEKTASGYAHVGSLIGVALHDVITYVLNERGVKATFHYEINDTDPMDGLPTYLDESIYRKHMGKPLNTVPAPDSSAESLADYFGNDFMQTIKDAGYNPKFYKTSELYNSGRMNDVVQTALLHADKIREIYKRVSGSEKADDWLPLNVICEKCGKVGTTKAVSFDGEMVTYVCKTDMVEWAEGCSHEGKVSPFDGNGTLPWKVEWAAKFKVMSVDVEGAGKDHSTKGGARDVARHIAEEVFDYKNPFDIPYEFFLVGGKKMSSSKGNAATAREFANLLPPHILKFALVGRDINKQTNFDPGGDSVPILYDKYDRASDDYWHWYGQEKKAEQLEKDDSVRVFEIMHDGNIPPRAYLPRFQFVAFLVQMPHLDIQKEVANAKLEDVGEKSLTDADVAVLNERIAYARTWLSLYAPEKYKFVIQEVLPESTKDFSILQKEALADILTYVEDTETLDGKTFHEKLHTIKEEKGIMPKELFTAIYRLFLDRDNGPQAGWFLSTLDRDLLTRRLKEAIQ